MPTSDMRMPRPFRLRATAAAGVVLTAVAITACGSSGPSTGSSPGASSGAGTAETGKQIFTDAGCAGCHTLAAAGANGNVGPDLDKLKPSDAAVVKQVTDGGGGMPSFKGSLSDAQIDSVARFVSTATGGGGS